MGPSSVTLTDALAGVSKLGFDTAPIIYYVEANATYDALVSAVFDEVKHGAITGITSTLSMTDMLVQPIRAGNNTLKARYTALLLRSRNFNTISIDPAISERAAELRAKYSLRTPDAIQIAAAIHSNCEAFLSNDKGHSRVSELRVLILDDLTL